MKKKKLGKTGMEISLIGFGGLPIQRISKKKAIDVIKYSYDKGINFFDTARSYTNSEERIGEALKDVRDEVIISTKDRVKNSGAEMTQSINLSLKKLQTDYIDLYQLHYVSSKDDWEKIKSNSDILEVLFKAKNEGIIRHLGVTSHNPDLAMEIINENIFETIMIPFNYITTQPKEKLLPYCRQKNIGTIIMKPFAGGTLSNASTALKYILMNENVDVVIPGMIHPKEVDENIAVASSSHSLTSMENVQIEEDIANLGKNFCRWCDYCKICPQQIPISFILRMERKFPSEKEWTSNTERVIREAIEKSKTCIDCKLCEQICPYNLPITDMIHVKAVSLKCKLTSYLSNI